MTPCHYFWGPDNILNHSLLGYSERCHNPCFILLQVELFALKFRAVIKLKLLGDITTSSQAYLASWLAKLSISLEHLSHSLFNTFSEPSFKELNQVFDWSQWRTRLSVSSRSRDYRHRDYRCYPGLSPNLIIKKCRTCLFVKIPRSLVHKTLEIWKIS